MAIGEMISLSFLDTQENLCELFFCLIVISCRWNKEHPDRLQEPEVNGCRTLWELFSKRAKDTPDRPYLGTRNAAVEGRPYEWKTFRNVYDLTDKFARGNNN